MGSSHGGQLANRNIDSECYGMNNLHSKAVTPISQSDMMNLVINKVSSPLA